MAETDPREPAKETPRREGELDPRDLDGVAGGGNYTFPPPPPPPPPPGKPS